MALLRSVATDVQLPIAAGNVWESTGTGLFYWFAVFKSVFQKCVCQNSLKRTSSLPFYIDIDFFFFYHLARMKPKVKNTPPHGPEVVFRCKL